MTAPAVTQARLASWPEIWPHLLPSALDLAQLGALVLVVAGFWAIGAWLRRLNSSESDDGVWEADLIVGWGAVVTVFVLFGAFTSIGFHWIAALVAQGAIGAAVQLWRDRRGRPTEPLARIAKLALLLAPLLLVTASLQPSENDDFGQWLPNLRYLLTVDHFPGPGLPISDSIFPAYPYATALVGYLVSLMTGSLSSVAVDHFNVMLLGTLALLVARLLGDATAGWRRIGFALALVTLLSPSFVPRLVLSNYVDGATSVVLAFAAYLAWRLVAAPAPRIGDLVQALFVFAVLILAKQANLVLLAAALGGVALTALSAGRLQALLRLTLPLVGAGLVYLAWRHVVQALGGGEMPMAGFSQWQWAVLPETLHNMAHVMVNKSGYFGLALIMVAVGLPLRNSCPMVLVFATAFVGFTVFLTWVYLAVYLGYEGRSAASFWRYHTQLGGLQILGLAAMLGRIEIDGFGRARVPPKLAHWGGALLLALLCLGPLAGAKQVRFDINPAKDHVRDAVQAFAPQLPQGARLLVADPNGDGFFGSFTRWYLGFQGPYGLDVSIFTPAGALPRLITENRITHIYVISPSGELETVLGDRVPPLGTSLYARTEDGTWRREGFWPFKGFDRIDAYKY